MCKSFPDCTGFQGIKWSWRAAEALHIERIEEIIWKAATLVEIEEV